MKTKFYADENLKKKVQKDVVSKNKGAIRGYIIAQIIMYIAIFGILFYPTVFVIKNIKYSIENNYKEDVFGFAIVGMFIFFAFLILQIIPRVTKLTAKRKRFGCYYNYDNESISFKKDSVVFAITNNGATKDQGTLNSNPYYEYIFKYDDIIRVEHDEKNMVYRVFAYPLLEEWTSVNKSVHANTTLPEEFIGTCNPEEYPGFTMPDFFAEKNEISNLMTQHLGERYQEKPREFDEIYQIYKRIRKEEKNEKK